MHVAHTAELSPVHRAEDSSPATLEQHTDDEQHHSRDDQRDGTWQRITNRRH